MIYLYFLLVLLFPEAENTTNAVPLTEWDEMEKRKGDDEAYSLTELTDGRIAFTGLLEGEKKKPLAFLKIVEYKENGNWETTQFITFNGHKASKAEKIREAPNGDIYIMGSADATAVDNRGRTQKHRAAWLWKSDAYGNYLGDVLLNASTPTSVIDFEFLSNGRIAVAGQRDGHPWVAVLDDELQVIEQKDLLSKTYLISDLEKGPNQSLVITGSKTGGISFFVELAADLTTKHQITNIANCRNSTAIKYHRGGDQFFLLGTDNSQGREPTQISIAAIDSTRQLQKEPLVTIEEDQTSFFPSDFLLTPWDELIFCGHLRGHSKDYPSPLLACLSLKDTSILWDAGPSVQTNKSDFFHEITLTQTGKIVLAGASVQRDKDMRLLLLSNHEKYAFEEGDSIQIDMGTLSVSGLKNDTVNAGEKGYFTIRIRNTGSESTYRLKAQAVFSPNRIQGLNCFRSIVIPPIGPGRSRQLNIPYTTDQKLFSDSARVRIRLFGPSTGFEQLSDDDLAIVSKARPVPLLKILPLDVPNLEKINREDTISMSIWVKNYGEGMARRIRTQFNTSYLVDVVDEPTQPIDSIPPGQQVRIDLQFVVHPFYHYHKMIISCLAFEEQGTDLEYENFEFLLTDYFRFEIPGTSPFIPPYPQEWQQRFGGPSAYMAPWSPPPVFRWHYSKEFVNQKLRKKGSGFTIYFRELYLKAYLRPSIRLKAKRIDILLNGEVYDHSKDGQKIQIVNGKEGNDILLIPLILCEGDNQIAVKIDGKLMDQSEIFIHYEPPVLHALVVGIPYTDLKFTQRDALQIEARLRQLDTGELYSKINVQSAIVEEKMTSAEELQMLFNSIIRRRYRPNGQKINKQDHFLFFISNHGYIDSLHSSSARYYIIGSDIKDRVAVNNLMKDNPKDNGVDLFHSFLHPLVSVMERSYIFVDGCFSGNLSHRIKDRHPDQVLQETLDTNSIVSRYPERLLVFPSSAPGVSSFESSNCGNGVLTQILLDAFSGKQYKIEKCKSKKRASASKKNPELDVAELYAFIEKRYGVYNWRNELLYVTPKEYVDKLKIPLAYLPIDSLRQIGPECFCGNP